MRAELLNQLLTRAMLLVFRATEDTAMLDTKLLTQDGGRCSNTRMATSSTRRARFLMYTVDLIMKLDKLLSGTNTMDSTNNGILCMLMNKRQSQRRDK
jgi:hypothetical protein